MARKPFPNGKNGGTERDRRGRFATGNRAAVGHGGGLAAQVQRLRSELVGAVAPADVKAIARRLVKDARGGDLNATRLLLAYALGKPLEADVFERLEALETLAAELGTVK